MIPMFRIRITIVLVLLFSLVGICAAVPADAIHDVYIDSRRDGTEITLVLHNRNKSKAIRATIRFTRGCERQRQWEEAVDLEAGGSRDLLRPVGMGSCLRPTTAEIIGATYY